MKHLLLFFIITVQLTVAKAQLNKLTWLVGGSGSLYSYNEDYTTSSLDVNAKYTSIDLSANVGYFVADKLVAGIRPYFSSFKGKSSGGGLNNSYHLAVGPFIRYYFLNLDKQFNLLTDINYQFGILQNLGVVHEKGEFNTFSAMTGIEAFFNSAVGIEFLLGYKNQFTSLNNSPSNYKDSKSGIEVSIGFQFHLKKN